MKYDVAVIGAGISGLTAAALIAKRGLSVAVIDNNYSPGGSCGVFKRCNATFDQGSAMLFGFGEHGFNSHRFVFNSLEEPIRVIRHDCLYCMVFKGKRIYFWPDVDRFAAELGEVFPGERENIRRFYADLQRIYRHVMMENPIYAPPDELDGRGTLRGMLRHPLSYARFLSFMNMNTHTLLARYFKDPEIFKFYDKLTSTYCYTTTAETPAILSSVMFVDNHVGGSFYPAGSSAFLPGKLEKVIEENGGDMLMERTVTRILSAGGQPSGIETDRGELIEADNIIYSGSVYNLYEKLLDPAMVSPEKQSWVRSLVMTYPSVVLYAEVDRSAISAETLAVEMLVGNPDLIDESEVTAYIPSIDDQTLCSPDSRIVMAIGPSLVSWSSDPDVYQRQKEAEGTRLLGVLERRFPGLTGQVRQTVLATPRTIERYVSKNGGAVAGPKQMLGQHMLRRQHTRTEWSTLFCCGESTVMGTGTPAVTVSGIAAANAVLRKVGKKPFESMAGLKNQIEVIRGPLTREMLNNEYPPAQRSIMLLAGRCQLCEQPGCMTGHDLDIRGIMRRVSVGNLTGARRLMHTAAESAGGLPNLVQCESRCIQTLWGNEPVAIRKVLAALQHHSATENS